MTLHVLLSWLSRRKLARALAGLLPAHTRAKLWAASYDMYENASEQFYAKLYLKYIMDAIQSVHPAQRLRILDLGCGHGRISIPIAAHGHEVIAVDTNEVALEHARKHAAKEGVAVEFRKGDFWSEDFETYDVVLAIESLRGSAEELRRFLSLAHKHLANRGLLIFAVRTRYYQATTMLRTGDYEGALAITDGTAGTNFLEPSELRETLLSNGYYVVSIFGIGVVSGLGSDPFATVANPGRLTAGERRMLEQIELELGSISEVSGCARYLLAIAKKNSGSS